MARVASYSELLALHTQYQPLLEMRRAAAPQAQPAKRQILVCGDTGCQASESQKVVERLERLIVERGLQASVSASITGCFGFCGIGPIIKIFPDNVVYAQVTPDDAESIIDEHIVGGNKVRRLLYKEPAINDRVSTLEDMGFYKKQQRRVLRNCGVINPQKIEEYIANRGYLALGKALTEMQPAQVIDTVKASGLRGRAGAGFLTGRKWEFSRMYPGDQKYIICNGDEGDPGAFMDRSIMEGNPHGVLEAMAIAGYAIGASQGFIYVRAEYPRAVERLQNAARQARELGLLGENILGTGFNFDLSVKLGAGAFVCGEETSLIHSLEGDRGEPTTKPPFPAQSGLWGKPTNVNNVETYANIPDIILEGPEWYKSVGTETSKGTKIFSLAGQVNNVGLVEVPMGATLRDIIFDIGGGLPQGLEYKAVQTGGPSGGCIPKQFLDTPIDFESLKKIGSIMGSGGLIVMSEKDCMVNIAKFYLEFTVDESCGKCTPCRVGNKRMHEILTEITEGRGKMEDLRELEELAGVIKEASLCGLGQTAPNPVLSTLKYFRDEYEAHVKEKRCPAGACQKLIQYLVLADKCVGCTACARVCPVSCISGAVKHVHNIDQTKCIKCGACLQTCKFHAIIKK
jgi:NADH:ubiquinone oxidoreductase subunit F (NADH-binding)/(2Fe-2S) ferredoxin